MEMRNFRLSFLGSVLLMAPLAAFCSPVLVVGTPGDNSANPNTLPSPYLNGTYLNFENLAPFSSFPSYTADGVTISSPDDLTVLPDSTQNPVIPANPLTPPNELFDDSPDGSANITIATSTASNAIGVGITDSDTNPPGFLVPVEIELQPLGAGGIDLGSAFLVQIPPDSLGNSDGYFVLEDPNQGLYGLQIVQPTDNANFSGLAITDVQVTPEPVAFPVMAGAMIAMFGFALRRKKA